MLSIAVLAAWARPAGRGEIAGLGFVAAAAAGFAYFCFVEPRAIPTDWLTVLRYGSEAVNISHLYATASNAGLNVPAVLHMLSPLPVPGLREQVWMSVGLAIVNVVVFFSIATWIDGVWYAIPVRRTGEPIPTANRHGIT